MLHIEANHSHTENLHIEACFRHAVHIDLDLRNVTIMAQLLFRNLSQVQLSNPQVVLHINSPHAILSGKLLSPELVQAYGVYSKGGRQSGWVFTDSEWFKQARTSGEYRLKSIEPCLLKPGEWQAMRDWQVECSLDHLQDPLVINGWMEVEKQQFLVLNPISITCSP